MIRSIKSPIQRPRIPRPVVPEARTFRAGSDELKQLFTGLTGFQDILALKAEVEGYIKHVQKLHEDTTGVLDEVTSQLQIAREEADALKQEHENQLEILRQEIDTIREEKASILLTEKGEPGLNGETPTEEKLKSIILPLIPPPIVPEMQKIDEDSIIKKVLRSIKISVPKKGKDADEEVVVQRLLDELTKGKRKINVKHLEGFKEGLEQTIAPIRSLAAGFRGGGDTVSAGSNITITTNNNGVKVIAASASGGTKVRDEVPTGSGTAFTLAHTPITNTLQIFRGGARQQVGVGNDYTISGANITLAITLADGEILLADYEY